MMNDDLKKVLDKLNQINFNLENDEKEIKNRWIEIVSSCSIDPIIFEEFINNEKKNILNKNLEINKYYANLNEQFNKAYQIALEKNTKQINLYHSEAEKQIRQLHSQLLEQKKKSNQKITAEQISYNKIAAENKKAYDDEMAIIQKEINETNKRSFLETQKLEHEKEKKLEIIENQFLAEKKRLENQLIEINKVYELKLIENDKELEDEIQNKDESYLTIKKTHTQTSVRLNNFINKVKQEFLDKKEQLNNEFFFKIEKIDEQILRKKEIFEKNKAKIQHLYLEKLKALNINNEVFNIGVEELELVNRYVGLFGVPEENFSIDLTIARGLDYYTGTVYETFLDNYPDIGSICSGGRYDDLAGFYTKQKLPGVGISIGLTRLFYQLTEAKLIKSEDKSLTKVIIIPMGDYLEKSVETASVLRQNSINTQVYLENVKTGKKFSFADKLGIPYAIIIGEEEFKKNLYTLRNMKTGEQNLLTLEEILNILK